MTTAELIATLLKAAETEDNIAKQMLFRMAAERLQELS
jgi:hypothetical protein